MREILGRSEWLKFAFLISTIIICSLIIPNIIEGIYFFLGNGSSYIEASENNQILGLTRLFTDHLALFIIPAVVCQMLFSQKRNAYIESQTASFKIYLQSIGLIVLLIFIGPTIVNATTYLLDLIGLKEWSDSLQNLSTEALEKIIARDGNTSTYLYKLFVVAVIPSIGEEFIFRGLLTKMFARITNNFHWGIVISSFLFSLYTPFKRLQQVDKVFKLHSELCNS